MEDRDDIVCSSGFTLLRPKQYMCALIILANLFDERFKIQHNALCTGSIMESITDQDMKTILIEPSIDVKKFTSVMEALSIIAML